MNLRHYAPLALAISLAGCGSFGAVGLGPMERQAPPQSDTLPPVASAPVEQSSLPPPPGGTVSNAPLTQPPAAGTMNPQASNGAPMSAPAAPSTASGGELGRTDLLGGWTLASGSESCQLFMTLTSWTGGYRASTRGCASPALKSISAWSLSGSQVVLAGAGGAPVAHLSSSGPSKFNGSLDGGQAVSFYR